MTQTTSASNLVIGTVDKGGAEGSMRVPTVCIGAEASDSGLCPV